MSLFAKIIFVFSLFQFHDIADAADCSKMPEAFKPMECCKFPKLADEEREKLKAVAKDLFKDKVTDYLSECKATEAFFKEMKLSKDSDINEAEITSMIDKIIDDPDWKPVLTAAVKECNKKVNAKLSDVQTKMEAAPFNVKKDQCNVKFGSFTTCIKMESFGKCPTSKWTDNKECSAGKQWYADCGNTIDSYMELHSKKTMN